MADVAAARKGQGEKVVTDPFDMIRAEQMIVGYSARWYDEPYEVLAVEAEFDTPLVNPETNAESRTFRLGGKIDLVVRDRRDGRVKLVEHKTSSEDCSPGSTYWKRALMSAQLSNYFVGARALGFDVTEAIFDVLVKPAQRPLKATPVESRKYTKDGRLYAAQRDADETTEEYRARISEAIAAEPDKFFVRGSVVRLENEEREAAFDAWQSAAAIREGRRAGRWPRNPDACVQYGSTCTFFPVCSGEESIENRLRYRQTDNVHEELSPGERKLPLLTSSELSSARRCSRLHHLRYDLGYRAVEDAENLRFGSLIHRGLERWWLGKKDGESDVVCTGLAIEMMHKKPGIAKVAPVTREAVAL